MDRFEKIVHRLTHFGIALGGAFLVAMMLVIVAVVFSRLLHIGIAGATEMVEVFVIVTVAFALPYTALRKGHVVIEILLNRFKPRTQAILQAFCSFLTLSIWGLITWSAAVIMLEKGLSEVSFLIKVPYLPFRIVWILGLILFCMAFLVDFIKSVRLAGTTK
jgi:TRAP-type C4-dicarboxylate transport system permease small subunit